MNRLNEPGTVFHCIHSSGAIYQVEEALGVATAPRRPVRTINILFHAGPMKIAVKSVYGKT